MQPMGHLNVALKEQVATLKFELKKTSNVIICIAVQI